MSDLVAMPAVFEAGTTVTYTKSFSDYPASDGWTATLYVSGPSLTQVAGTASGSAFIFTLTISLTARLDAGDYVWEERVEKAGVKKVADAGVVLVTANIISAGSGDLVSYEAKALKLVEEQLLARYAADVASYTIEQRAKVLLDIKDLEATRGRLLRAIDAKRNKGRFLTPVEVTFGDKA